VPAIPPYTEVTIDDVIDVQIVPIVRQMRFIEEMKRSLEYFFRRGTGSYSDHFGDRAAVNFPFKGFVLSGPPGNGKTEAVRIVFRDLWGSLDNEKITLRLFHINAADVNKAGVGDIERNIRKIFKDAKDKGGNTRTILLIDDIETLIVGRRDDHTTEWSRAANGVFFHELDRLSSDDTLVVATTNEPDLIDPAIRSRLSMREVPVPDLEEMLQVAEAALPNGQHANLPSRDELMGKIQSNIESAISEGTEGASFRLARKAAIEVIITEVVGWR